MADEVGSMTPAFSDQLSILFLAFSNLSEVARRVTNFFIDVVL